MTLAEIRGQDAAVERLRRALRAGRLGHALVFAGPSGVGKNTTAFALARALLCQVRPGEGCDRCAECPRVCFVLAVSAVTQVGAGTEGAHRQPPRKGTTEILARRYVALGHASSAGGSRARGYPR